MRADLSSKQRELFLGEQNAGIEEPYSTCEKIQGGDTRDGIGVERVEKVDHEIGELSALIEELEYETKHTENSIIRSWAARRQSHSTVNPAKSVKHRENPSRSEGSLTLRERKFMHHTEERIEKKVNIDSWVMSGVMTALGRINPQLHRLP